MQDDSGTDFGLLLAQALNGYVEHLHRELGERGFTDLRPTFGLLLRALHAQPRTLTDLSRELGVSKQAAAKVVGEVERRGLVEREPSPVDRRATVLRLSARGEALVTAAIEIGNTVERDLPADVGLRDGLERLAHDPPWAGGEPPKGGGRIW